MIATREPGPQVPPERSHAIPSPPDMRFRNKGDACAVTLAFNGLQYRAVLEIQKGFVQPEAVARMLDDLSAAIRLEVK